MRVKMFLNNNMLYKCEFSKMNFLLHFDNMGSRLLWTDEIFPTNSQKEVLSVRGINIPNLLLYVSYFSLSENFVL